MTTTTSTTTATTMLETARDRVAARLAEDQHVQVSTFAPELLTLIAEAVMMVLENCLSDRSAAEVADRMRQPGLIETLSVRKAVRDLLRESHGPFGFYRYGGAALTEAILKSGRDATDEERGTLLAEIRRAKASSHY